MPPAPERSFASDNTAGIHPLVLEAIARANHGHALAYGDDEWTARCEERFRLLFGSEVATLLTFNGTGANVMALAALLRPTDAVVCAASAHINTDETGAPERILGAKLIDLPAPGGKLTPDQLDAVVASGRGVHHAQPAVVSISQPTELGTVYSLDELAGLCEAAHRLGLLVHMDGARLSNAVAALGGDDTTLRAMTVDAGVDVASFGGTKAGLLAGEAVVFLRPELAGRAGHVRKLVTQLPSKMRFVAAQFEALLTDGLWLDLARSANDMAALLHQHVDGLAGLDAGPAPAVNSMFPVIDRPVVKRLQTWSFFWDWDPGASQVRWMTAWDTTTVDVERFVAGVTVAVSGSRDDLADGN
ncbi:MAG: threonine aldolase family protein [Desertimonas sp.]